MAGAQCKPAHGLQHIKHDFDIRVVLVRADIRIMGILQFCSDLDRISSRWQLLPSGVERPKAKMQWRRLGTFLSTMSQCWRGYDGMTIMGPRSLRIFHSRGLPKESGKQLCMQVTVGGALRALRLYVSLCVFSSLSLSLSLHEPSCVTLCVSSSVLFLYVQLQFCCAKERIISSPAHVVSFFLSFILSFFLSFCLSVCLSFCLSVFLSFCLSVLQCGEFAER